VDADAAVRRGLVGRRRSHLAELKKAEAMNRIPFPAMKRPLIAILRGIKPEETEGVVAR
jgi:hypothetical protein